MDIKDLIIYKKTIPSRPAEYTPYPQSLSPELVSYLTQAGLSGLYSHLSLIHI